MYKFIFNVVAEKPQTLKSCLKQGDTTVGSRLLDLCSIKPKQSSPTQPQPQTATLQGSSNPNIANPTSRRETNPVWTTGVSNQVRPPNYGYSQQQVIIPKLSPPRRVIEGPAVYQPRTSVQNGTTRLIQPLPSSIPQFQTISSTVTRNPVQYKTNQVYNDERQFEQARGYRNILPQNIDGIPVGRSLSNTSSLERDEPRHMQTRPTYNTLDHPLQQVSNQILIAQQRTHSASSNGDKRSNSEKSEKERLEEHIRRIQSDLRSDSLKRTPSHSPPPQIIRGPGDGLATAGLRQSNLVPHNLGGASIVHTNAGVQRMAPVVQHGRVGSYVQSQVNGQTYNQMSSLPIDQLRSGSLDYSESSGHEAGFRSTIDRGSLQGQGRPSSLSRQILGTPRFGEEF